MNSFTLIGVGNLARNPELTVKGDTTYARFCLVGNDYAGQHDGGTNREVVTASGLSPLDRWVRRLRGVRVRVISSSSKHGSATMRGQIGRV